MDEFNYQELEEATENFSSANLIGKGSHGSIYKGTLEHGTLIVAVKKQSLGLHKLQDNSKLENEARILSTLMNRHHNNNNGDHQIMNLLGMTRDSLRQPVLVMEYMPNGTLHSLLHGGSACSGGSPPSSFPPISWAKRAQIAIQVARAVRFLHEGGDHQELIIHRDIKSANILFDSSWNARLADFGLAVRFDDVSELPAAGTIGYLDPCYTSPRKLSTRVDVFSFGVLLLEIISGRKVIDVSISPALLVDYALDLMKNGRIMEVCDKKIAMPRCMRGCVTRMLDIAARCVSIDENSRPTISEVVTGLENSVIERARFPPIWVNTVVQSLVLPKRRKKTSLKKVIIATTTVAATAAAARTTTIVCVGEANVECDVEITRKPFLREILAGNEK